MSELDRLLQSFVAPAVSDGLARRAVAGAIKQPQQPALPTSRQRDRRGDWKRPLWIGVAGFGLAFTTAVAATVVSGGRIEIPVVQQVVESIPVLHKATRKNEPVQQLARAETKKKVEPKAVDAVVTEVASVPPVKPGWQKAQLMQKMALARQHVEARRAAGLPTPNADRIERRANAIVEQRKAAGLPTPSVEEVEAGLAMHELRRARLMRRAGNIDPSTLSDAQLARIAERLPPAKRERFAALPPDMQRQLVGRTLEQMRMRQAARQYQANAEPEPGPTADPSTAENSAR